MWVSSKFCGPQLSFIFGENDLLSFSASTFCNSVEPGQVLGIRTVMLAPYHSLRQLRGLPSPREKFH